MNCPQLSELQKQGVFIDRYPIQEAKFVFITHAHADHLVKFNPTFFKKTPGVRLHCTEITRDLIFALRPNLIKYHDKFHVVEPNQQILCKCKLPMKTWAISVQHCPGACMFLFDSILYTGDFRFSDTLRNNELLMTKHVQSFVYDNTFEHIDTPFPSWKHTIKQFAHLLQLQRGAPLFVSMNKLGFESILQHFAGTYKFYLDDLALPPWRVRQIEYLLPSATKMGRSLSWSTKKNAIVLVNRHQFDTRYPNHSLVVPSGTLSLCLLKNYELHKNKQLIWFATHSNGPEIRRLQLLLDVPMNRMLACRNTIQVTCNRKNKIIKKQSG